MTGQVPLPGVSLEQVAAAHMLQSPPRPSAVQDGVPVAIDHVIAKGMAKDPGERYATTLQFAREALDAVTTPIRRFHPTPAPETKPATETKPAPAPSPAPQRLRLEVR